MPDWLAARAQMMLDPKITNLNTGSFGPTPRPVFERVTELRQHQAAAPWDFIVRVTPPLLWNSRQRLAEFVGSRAGTIDIHAKRLDRHQHRCIGIENTRAGIDLDFGPRVSSDAVLLGTGGTIAESRNQDISIAVDAQVAG